MDDPSRPRRRTRLLAVTALVVAVCAAVAVVLVTRDDGGDDRDEDPAAADPTPTPTAGASTTTTPAVPAEPVCADGGLGQRTYILCTAGDTPDQPLIVALHGRGSTAAEMQAGTELDRVGAASGFAVVFPDGLEQGWGDDTFPTPTRPAGDEDVVFLDELVATLRGDARIGDGPVGVVGFSNGASMALRYASQRPDGVRAVVAVAGQLPRDAAIRPSAPVPLLAIYGTADPIRNYDAGVAETPGRQPGQPTPTLSTPDTVDAFVAAAGTGLTYDDPIEADPDPSDGTSVRTEVWTWTTSETMVVLQSVVGGGHTWPSARTTPRADFGVVSRDLDASVDAVAFIEASS